MMQLAYRGLDPEAGETLGAALNGLVAGLVARDRELFAVLSPQVLVAGDFEEALAEAGMAVAGAAVAQAVHRADGVTLILDGRRVAAALAGPPAELARLVHLLHRELWRIQEAARRQANPAPALNEFEEHLQPVVEGLWTEYVSTRRAVWSLPADADLLLPHLADLLQALPPATAEDLTLALAEGQLGDLFARALGRVTHLMQVVGHVQGYLAGLGRSLASLSPELAAQLHASFLGPRWERGARLLDALYGSCGQWDGEFLHNTLRPEVLAVFAALGMDLRADSDGGVWLEPRPVAAGGVIH
jgi:hypothetical protein